jgi:hypothetical protein
MIRQSHDMEVDSLYGTRPPRGRRPANGDQPGISVDVESAGALVATKVNRPDRDGPSAEIIDRLVVTFEVI